MSKEEIWMRFALAAIGPAYEAEACSASEISRDGIESVCEDACAIADKMTAEMLRRRDIPRSVAVVAKDADGRIHEWK